MIRAMQVTGVATVAAAMYAVHLLAARKTRPSEEEQHAAEQDKEKKRLLELSLANADRLPPQHWKGVFDPAVLIGCPAASLLDTLKALSPQLPVQLHFNPMEADSVLGPPMYARLMKLYNTIPVVSELLKATPKVKWKLRVSPKGKFIHRNRYPRKSTISVLHGSQHWLLIDSTSGKKAQVDELVGGYENENWNGFRSTKYQTMLSLEQMHELRDKARAMGVEAHVLFLTAGDCFTFDGMWWHATSYSEPVLSVFVTLAKDAAVALFEHTRRMKMPKQKGLHIGSIKMAKVSQLSGSGAGSWLKDRKDKAIDWEADE